MEDKHLEPLKKVCKEIHLKKDLSELTVKDQEKLITLFHKQLKKKHKPLVTYFQKHFATFFGQKKNVDNLVGKWAWFPDIDLQLGFQESFGIIYGVRNSESWKGLKYFVKRPHMKSLLEISNSSVLIFDIKSDFYDIIVTNEQEQKLMNLLNIFCEVLLGDTWKIVKLSAFDDKTVDLMDTNKIKHTVDIEYFLNNVRNYQEEQCVLSMMIMKNK